MGKHNLFFNIAVILAILTVIVEASVISDVVFTVENVVNKYVDTVGNDSLLIGDEEDLTQKPLLKSIDWNEKGDFLVTGSDDGYVKLWDASKGDHLQTFKGHTKAVNSVNWGPYDLLIASGSDDGTVRLWNLSGISSLEIIEVPGFPRVHSVFFCNSGIFIVTASSDYIVRVFKTTDGHAMLTMTGHIDEVISAAFSPDNLYIVSGGLDHKIIMWDAFSGDIVCEFKGHTDAIMSITWSPDGAKIASGSKDKTIRVWSPVTGKELKKFTGHTAEVNSVSWHPNNIMLISGSHDKTFRGWDVTSGKVFKTICDEGVEAVVLSPDGGRLVYGDWYGMVHIAKVTW